MSSSSELMTIASPAELERGGRVLFLKEATRQHNYDVIVLSTGSTRWTIHALYMYLLNLAMIRFYSSSVTACDGGPHILTHSQTIDNLWPYIKRTEILRRQARDFTI